MAHKKKHAHPVPPDNQPAAGPPVQPGELPPDDAKPGGGAPAQEQDPKRRLGNYGTAGEHPIQQPGGRNDANH